MPVRRRIAKFRDTQPAWEMMFIAGHDFFRELPGIGVETNQPGGDPPRAITEAAWAKFGQAFLDQYTDRFHVPWALREFGEPGRPRRAGP